ncbi:MAG: PhoH family protein [Gammaproteobacteria bacterium]|mgnify:FL=1
MQTSQESYKDISLSPSSADRIAVFVGELNGNIKLIEKTFSVKIFHKGDNIKITGTAKDTKYAAKAIKDLYGLTNKNLELTKETVHLCIQSYHNLRLADKEDKFMEEIVIQTPKKLIKSRSKNQQDYLKNIKKYELNFGVGPAGTGKTYLAVAAAVDAFISNKVQKIILIRPAIEAGEKLGFLPGDLAQKVDPYLKPLYDALYEMMGNEKVNKLIEKEVIEIAPLAYLRGRTLNNSFIIIDESQNTSIDQMKMVLTRLGYGSRAVVNGDLGQIDLPKTSTSGLKNILEVLDKESDIGITHFDSQDVVRHPLVRKIINAYRKYNEAIKDDKD